MWYRFSARNEVPRYGYTRDQAVVRAAHRWLNDGVVSGSLWTVQALGVDFQLERATFDPEFAVIFDELTVANEFALVEPSPASTRSTELSPAVVHPPPK